MLQHTGGDPPMESGDPHSAKQRKSPQHVTRAHRQGLGGKRPPSVQSKQGWPVRGTNNAVFFFVVHMLTKGMRIHG